MKTDWEISQELRESLRQLREENEKLKIELEVKDKHLDEAFDKIEDLREIITLFTKVW